MEMADLLISAAEVLKLSISDAEAAAREEVGLSCESFERHGNCSHYIISGRWAEDRVRLIEIFEW
jgi:hypothetical protein